MFIRDFLRARRISAFSREQVLALQKDRLRQTLLQAYAKSPFYKDLWSRAGVTRDDLLNLNLNKLPLTTKQQLMENFDAVITQPNISKAAVEKFIAEDEAGAKLFSGKYVALNTSGTSGYVGIFLFEQKFWTRLISTLIARLLPWSFSTLLFKKIRVAFLGEITGHHAGISLIRSAPGPFFETLSLSETASPAELIEALKKFQPNILTGYAGALVHAAESKMKYQLELNPELIISSGEPLNQARRQIIKSAFHKEPIDFYSATECLALGLDKIGQGALDIFDDLVFLEVVDKAGQLVPPGTLGRVVITVLENNIFPLVRYVLDDEIVIRPTPKAWPFTQATAVAGRDLEHLILKLPQGELEIHPMELVGFFLPGLESYQIIQTGPASIRLLIVAKGEREQLKSQITKAVAEFLKGRGIAGWQPDLEVQFVDLIPPDRKTGKTPIIVPLR